MKRYKVYASQPSNPKATKRYWLATFLLEMDAEDYARRTSTYNPTWKVWKELFVGRQKA